MVIFTSRKVGWFLLRLGHCLINTTMWMVVITFANKVQDTSWKVIFTFAHKVKDTRQKVMITFANKRDTRWKVTITFANKVKDTRWKVIITFQLVTFTSRISNSGNLIPLSTSNSYDINNIFSHFSIKAKTRLFPMTNFWLITDFKLFHLN